MAKIVLYSDLNAYTPFDEPLLTNVEAVYSFILNLLNTDLEERPFRPYLGLPLDQFLFDLSTDVASLQIYQLIIEAFEIWLPIVKLNYGATTITPIYDEYKYLIDVYFSIEGWQDELFIGGEITK